MTHPEGEEITKAFGRVLQPRRVRSYQFSQPELEDSKRDQFIYQERADKFTDSSVQEAAASERNGYCVTAMKVRDGGCLSRCLLMGESNSLSSESRNGVIVSGISEASSAAGCLLTESVEADVSEEGIEVDPLESGNQKGKSFICGQCGKRLKTKYSFNRHMKGMHSSDKLYKCKLCEETFKARNLLYVHTSSHRENLRYRCSECGEGFQWKQRYTDHLRKHGAKVFPCAHCGADFRYRGDLEKHYPLHDGEADWSCQNCGEKYRKWSELVDHITTHKVKTGFKCDICGVEYSRKDYLRKHINRHISLHSCPICNKAYASSSDLLRHSYSHGGINPHKCPICNQGCYDKGTLTKHLKTHSEERLFPCNFCSYRAETEKGLQVHDCKLSSSERYQCSFCDRKYATNYNKLVHERYLHKDKVAK